MPKVKGEENNEAEGREEMTKKIRYSRSIHRVPFFDTAGRDRKFGDDEGVEEGCGPRPPLSTFQTFLISEIEISHRISLVKFYCVYFLF